MFPLAEAGVVEQDVMQFWRESPFDLKLQTYEGNCDLCFLKAAGKIQKVMRDRPDLAQWWIDMEKRTGQRFRKDRPSYAAQLHRSQQESLFPLTNEPDELGIACHCTD